MSPIAISPSAGYCHCDVILIVSSFATELACTPTVTDKRTDTLPRLIYKDLRRIEINNFAFKLGYG